MELKTKMTKEVYTEFVEYSVKHIPYYQKMLKQSLFISVFCGSAILFGYGIIKILNGDYITAFVLVLLGVLFLLIFPRLGFLKKFQTKSIARANYKRQVKANIVKPEEAITVSLTEEGVGYSSRGNRSFASWEGIYALHKSDNLILIYVDQMNSLPIHVSAFENNEALDKCYEICEHFKYQADIKKNELNR